MQALTQVNETNGVDGKLSPYAIRCARLGVLADGRNCTVRQGHSARRSRSERRSSCCCVSVSPGCGRLDQRRDTKADRSCAFTLAGVETRRLSAKLAFRRFGSRGQQRFLLCQQLQDHLPFCLVRFCFQQPLEMLNVEARDSPVRGAIPPIRSHPSPVGFPTQRQSHPCVRKNESPGRPETRACRTPVSLMAGAHAGRSPAAS
jgi:hypothetical protein